MANPRATAGLRREQGKRGGGPDNKLLLLQPTAGVHGEKVLSMRQDALKWHNQIHQKWSAVKKDKRMETCEDTRIEACEQKRKIDGLKTSKMDWDSMLEKTWSQLDNALTKNTNVGVMFCILYLSIFGVSL